MAMENGGLSAADVALLNNDGMGGWNGMIWLFAILALMGGGFGGCTINLVEEVLYKPFIETAKAKYKEKYGKEPKVIDVVIGDGARKLC